MTASWKDNFFGITGPGMGGNLQHHRVGGATVYSDEDWKNCSFHVSSLHPGEYRPDFQTIERESVILRKNFRKGGAKEAKYLHHFIEHYFVICVTVNLSAKNWFGKRWLKKAFQHNPTMERGVNSEKNPSVFYEIFFAYSYATGKWYALNQGYDIYEIELEVYDRENSMWWYNDYQLPIIGTNELDKIRDYFIDKSIMRVCTSGVVDQLIAEEKEEHGKEVVYDQVRDGLTRHLSQTLVDGNFKVEDEESREKLISLVVNGDLELEGVNISKLDVEGLIEQISDRLPEDQQQAFRDRTQELINAYTGT